MMILIQIKENFDVSNTSFFLFYPVRLHFRFRCLICNSPRLQHKQQSFEESSGNIWNSITCILPNNKIKKRYKTFKKLDSQNGMEIKKLPVIKGHILMTSDYRQDALDRAKDIITKYENNRISCYCWVVEPIWNIAHRTKMQATIKEIKIIAAMMNKGIPKTVALCFVVITLTLIAVLILVIWFGINLISWSSFGEEMFSERHFRVLKRPHFHL